MLIAKNQPWTHARRAETTGRCAVARQTLNVVRCMINDREVVLDFFATFSRVEYSLKRSGFLRRGREDRAEPDWPSYAETLSGRLTSVESSEFHQARAWLTNHPPKMQVIRSGGLGWDSLPRRKSDTGERYLLRLVQTVRNNLFHGGKYPYPDGPVLDVARDRQLLEYSITVLDTCLDLSPRVRAAFEEAA